MEVLEVDESYILEISEGITPNLKDKIMSTYDRLIEKGIGKGIEQGIEQKTIDVIRNCVKNDIKIPMISNITGLSDQRVIEIIKSLGL